MPTLAELSATGLLLIFAFGGYEVVPVPAGEARDPRRAVPFALVMTILIATLLMTLVQVVALGTLPGLAASKTPLTDASLLFMGASGAILLTIGAVFSTTGNNMGQALSGSRNLYALAEQGDLPRVLAWIHPRFRTPMNAIIFTSAIALVLALSGRYSDLALVSAISRLLVYVGTCAAMLRLRSPQFAGSVMPPTFVVPFGALIPSTAIVIALAILAGARREQLVAGGIALVVGGILYAIAVRGRPIAVAGLSRRLEGTMVSRVLTVFFVASMFALPAAAQHTVFLVRHAERADSSPGTSPTMAADPDLSAAGRARADHLAEALKDAKITAIFATEFKRTQQTAAPLAKALGLTVKIVSSNERSQSHRGSQGRQGQRPCGRPFQHRAGNHQAAGRNDGGHHRRRRFRQSLHRQHRNPSLACCGCTIDKPCGAEPARGWR